MPPLLAVAGSEAISFLKNSPTALKMLQENVHAVRLVLERTEGITVLGHWASPVVHFCLKCPRQTNGVGSGTTTVMAPPIGPSFEYDAEEKILQDIVDDVLSNG